MQRLEKTAEELNAITSRIIGLAIALHETFGPGLLETVYVRCLRPLERLRKSAV
jgi:PD-(D/E)XK nuclease superfamily